MLDDLDSASDIDKGAWKKMYNNMSTAGFREGVAAGRDSVFQKGFDVGYLEGYMNGYSLGYIKGVMRIQRLVELTIAEIDNIKKHKPNHTDTAAVKSQFGGIAVIRNKFMEGKEADDSAKQLDPDLEKTSRGMCVLCLEEKQRTKEESNSVSDIIEKQSKSLKHCIERLKTD